MDTLAEVLSVDAASFRFGIRVGFEGEEGQDEGGLTRELLQLFGEAMLKPVPEPRASVTPESEEHEGGDRPRGPPAAAPVQPAGALDAAALAASSGRLDWLQGEPPGGEKPVEKSPRQAKAKAGSSGFKPGLPPKRRPSLFKLTGTNAAQPEPCTTSVRLPDIHVPDDEGEDAGIGARHDKVLVLRGHHGYYQGAGRIVGMALRGGDMIGVHFATFFLKQVRPWIRPLIVCCT